MCIRDRLHYASLFIIRPLPKTLVVFLAAALGVENLQAVTNLLPAFVMNGLSEMCIRDRSDRQYRRGRRFHGRRLSGSA